MRKTFASRALGPISLLLLLGSSCSLVYDLSPDQCGSNADCVSHFGAGFTCDQGVCTCREATCMGSGARGGSSGKGGSSGSGGSSGNDGEAGTDAMTGGTGATSGSGGATAGKGGTGGTTGKGGTGGTAGKGGTGGTDAEGGMAGEPFVPECANHKDCSTKYSDDWEDNPRACVEGTCVPLMSPECPFVLPLFDNGEWNLLTKANANAIILGGYAAFNAPALGTFGRNYDLALTELSRKSAGGVYAGSTRKREVVMVVCNTRYETQDKLLDASEHLMVDLKVPGVLSALLLQDQTYVWDNVARDNQVLMMTPVYSDQSLIDTPDDGLIWNMLSGANALSVSYQPLLDMTVGHLKALGSLGETEDLKVAQVKAQDEPFLQDTADYLEDTLTFNGQSVGDNLDADLYRPISVISDYEDPTDDQATAINSILTFAPHIVIGTTVSELFKRIIPGVESGWATQNPSQARPFYLVGALGYLDSNVANMISNDSTGTLFKRILGVNWPAAVDQTVYEEYQDRWLAAYTQREDGYENYYDAAYYLLYGVAAARAPLNGLQIAKGLQRVIAHGTNVPQVVVGPNDDLLKYIGELASDTQKRIEVIGAMGPPNWDEFGARNDPGSIWCLNALGGYRPDQLRYDPDTSTLQPSDPNLPTSTISCFDFPEE